MTLGLVDYAQTCWMEFLSELEDSVLVCDTAALELTHWTITTSKLLSDHRVIAVHHVSDKVISYETSSIYFLIGEGSTLTSLSKTLERWIDSDTQLVTVLSLLSLPSLRVLSGKDNPDCYYLDMLSDLNNIYPNTIFNFSIYPVSCFTFTNSTFITPASRRLFPLVECDLVTMASWLKCRGDNRSPEIGQVITMAMLPRTLQQQIKLLAEELGNLFDELRVVEDCYSVGSLSRVVVDQVVAGAGKRTARKHSTRKLSMVVVDRTLDLYSASSHDYTNTANLLYNNLEELFPGSNDVKVDLKPLFNKRDSEFTINGSISDSKSVIPISTLLTTDHVTLSDDVISSLEGQIQLDPETLESKDLMKILSETDTYSKYQNFLHFQILAGILEGVTNSVPELSAYLTSTDTSLLWTTLEDSVLVGQLANSITSPHEDHTTPLHLIMLLTHLYSLFGPLSDRFSDTDAIELAKLKNVLFKKLKSSDDPFSRSAKSGSKSEEDLHDKIAKMFVRLEALSTERGGLSQLGSLSAQSAGAPSYTPLVQQIVELCLDSSEDLVDVEYRSGGLRDLLKTGLGLFTRAVTKPRPTCPLLLYVVGGVTCSEVAWVEEYRARTGREVYLGSNCVLSHEKLARMMLINDNLFGG